LIRATIFPSVVGPLLGVKCEFCSGFSNCLFLTSLTLEVDLCSLLVHRPSDSEPVLPAAVTDDDESKAAAEPDAEPPAPSPEAKPDKAAPVLEPSPARP
jgi:hypothetical protein